jgi:hypothetical protein
MFWLGLAIGYIVGSVGVGLFLGLFHAGAEPKLTFEEWQRLQH